MTMRVRAFKAELKQGEVSSSTSAQHRVTSKPIPEIPEDLYHLIKKAVSIRKHLERNKKDKDSKFKLILINSRIYRLARYYKTKEAPASLEVDGHIRFARD
ncbi:hypothetical protein JHK82_031909 [Glycine max]|nr:hypothetical protein JHK85_032571 [Glycine max]KAG4995178.1 hypothetical protein JHK86_032005 [Glycine max]KAG5125172.1 hypothetical protein JHK82_031909 [Glycine max]